MPQIPANAPSVSASALHRRVCPHSAAPACTVRTFARQDGGRGIACRIIGIKQALYPGRIRLVGKAARRSNSSSTIAGEILKSRTASTAFIMHAAHQPHGLISMFGRLVAHGQHAGKRIVHHQVNTGVGSLSCVDAHAHFDHQRRRAQHDMAGGRYRRSGRFHLLHIACGKGHAISFTRCVVSTRRAPALQHPPVPPHRRAPCHPAGGPCSQAIPG